MGAGVGGRLKREGIFVYFELIKLWYSKNYHTVKQLYSNGKKIKQKDSVKEISLSPFQKNKKQVFREFTYLCKVSQLLTGRGGFLTQLV